MVYTYMAVFRKQENNDIFYAWIPDIAGCIATGAVFNDVDLQITEALMGFLLDYEDADRPIPEPTPEFDIEHEEDDLVWPITIDTDAYRSMLNNLDFAAVKAWRNEIIATANAPDSEFVTEDELPW